MCIRDRKLTKDVYDVKRGNFGVLKDSHVTSFEKILGNDRVLTDASDVEPYNVDWIKMVRGKKGFFVFMKCLSKTHTHTHTHTLVSLFHLSSFMISCYTTG